MTDREFTIAADRLQPENKVPLYAQLTSIIRCAIADGTLQVGDMLPTEESLCSSLHIGRSTVRKAFSQLESEGKIVRRRGKGTFVSKPKLRRNLNTLYNFSNEMAELGMTPSSEVIRFEVRRPDPFIAAQLHIEESEYIYRITRLRKADGKPILLETAYIPVIYCSGLTWDDLNDSLYALIHEHTGALPAEAVEIYESISLREREAAYLNCKVGSPAFRISRTSKNTNGDIFEFSTILAPGEINKYEITLRRNDVFLSNLVSDPVK